MPLEVPTWNPPEVYVPHRAGTTALADCASNHTSPIYNSAPGPTVSIIYKQPPGSVHSPQTSLTCRNRGQVPSFFLQIEDNH
jgi:hypothetical protein